MWGQWGGREESRMTDVLGSSKFLISGGLGENKFRWGGQWERGTKALLIY